MDPLVIQVRREVCAVSCRDHCAAYVAGTLDHADPHASCPRAGWILAWGCYGPCHGPTPAARGLGDAVAAVAQPIARAIDRALGTNLQNCGVCKQRQEALNKLVPRLPLS
jgi:hypothetical protein